MASSQGMQLQLQPIILMLVLVQLVVVVILSLSAATIAAPTAQELKNLGCTKRCGNLDISYPFGREANCYLNDNFFINCNDSQPYIWNSTIVVTNISLEDGELRIMQFVASDCYDESGYLLPNSFDTSLTLPQFSISNSKNKFTAIGCDTQGSVLITNKDGSSVVATGCESQCSSLDSVPNDGSCSGIGCCQTSIPKGVGQIEISVNSFSNHSNITDFNPCSYAFVVEDGAFNFSTTYLKEFKAEELPTVIDWGIGDNKTCEEAKKNQTSYACGQNTTCYDTEDGNGYICKCSKGYEGNPYLSDGCKDIDECANPNQCVDGSKCLNTPPGNYTCSCPKRYHGDGKIDGTRCTADADFVLHIVIGSAAGVALVLLCSSWLYWILRKRKYIKLKEKFFLQNGGSILRQQLSKLERSTQEVFKIVTKEELKEAVEKGKIVGQGGHGIVYKGTLADGRLVAIKECKFKEVDQSQIEQFINKIVVLSQINHRNVVKLLGCCLETQIPALVYEFVTNGTLHDHIHEEPAISWQIRLRIATEAAGVLSYLHSEASIRIIHRDVKPMNILLDHNYTAKVSDFGASRLVPLNQNPLATGLEGTPGSFDPESLHTGQLTEKSDVYSFGVVLAELITGKKVLSFERPKEERYLATYFLSSLKNDRLYQDIDEHIVIEGDTFEQLKEVAGIAERCLKVKGDERPTMKEVATELEGLIAKKMENKHPWVKTKSGVSSEETEDLLGENSNWYEIGDSGNNTTTIEFYSVSEQPMLPLHDGR